MKRLTITVEIATEENYKAISNAGEAEFTMNVSEEDYLLKFNVLENIVEALIKAAKEVHTEKASVSDIKERETKSDIKEEGETNGE